MYAGAGLGIILSVEAKMFRLGKKGEIMTKEEFRKRIVNCTPHPIIFRFSNGMEDEDITIKSSGVTIDASSREEVVKIDQETKIVFVKTTFHCSEKGMNEIRKIRTENSAAIIIGSIISAQAYPEMVVAMTPVPGFERVPPDQKRMNPMKFTVFSKYV